MPTLRPLDRSRKVSAANMHHLARTLRRFRCVACSARLGDRPSAHPTTCHVRSRSPVFIYALSSPDMPKCIRSSCKSYELRTVAQVTPSTGTTTVILGRASSRLQLDHYYLASLYLHGLSYVEAVLHCSATFSSCWGADYTWPYQDWWLRCAAPFHSNFSSTSWMAHFVVTRHIEHWRLRPI